MPRNYHIPENEIPRICEECGQPFYPKRYEYTSSWKKRRFCSIACSGKALGKQKTILNVIRCAFCKKIFKPRESRTKYCSLECYWSDRKSEEKKFFIPSRGYRVTLVCLHCKKQFEVTSFYKKRKFCSQECYYDYLRNKRPRNLIRRTESNSFYLTVEWRKLKEEISERDNYTCQRCKRKFCKGANGMIIHHIKERVEFNVSGESLHQIADDPSNLVTLCHSCHQKVHTGSPLGI